MSSSARTARRRRITRRPARSICPATHPSRASANCSVSWASHRALMARVAPILTVYSRQQGINLETAPREVLLALPERDAGAGRCLHRGTRRSLEEQAADPAVPSGPGVRGAQRAPVWRIHVLARTPDGVTFARDAVVRLVERSAASARHSAVEGRGIGNDVRHLPRAENLHRKMEPASPDLRQRLRVASRRLGLTAFWRWWVGELAPLVPRRLRNVVGRIRMRPVLVWGESERGVVGATGCGRPPCLQGSRPHTVVGRRGRRGARCDRSAVEFRRRRIGRIARGSSSRCPRVRFCARRSPCRRRSRTTSLKCSPTTSTGTRRSSPTKMYFDARIVGRDIVRKELRVDWAAALASRRGSNATARGELGRAVVAVTPDRPPAARCRRAASAQSAARKTSVPRHRRLRGLGGLGALALLVAAVLFATALPLWQKRGYAIALHAAGDAGARRRPTRRMRCASSSSGSPGDYNFALSRKYAFPSALQSVEDLSKLLPDDTWLTQLEMKNPAKGKEAKREIVVRGESANAGRLISLFEESKLFSDAAPRSPTTKIQPGPGEIFDVGAQLKPLPPPVPCSSQAPARSRRCRRGPRRLARLLVSSQTGGGSERRRVERRRRASATRAPAKADAAPQAGVGYLNRPCSPASGRASAPAAATPAPPPAAQLGAPPALRRTATPAPAPAGQLPRRTHSDGDCAARGRRARRRPAASGRDRKATP